MSKKKKALPKKLSTSKANPLWGGHYRHGPAIVMAAINASIDVDKRLYAEDIEASKAHAAMLAQAKIINAKDLKAIQIGLDKIQKDIERGEFSFSADLEDIHMNIEARLKERIGDAAGRLHTARSRNDQVATDFRLWLRHALDDIDRCLKELEVSLLEKADKNAATLMPGYTHLQAAQPITFGHHLMAYFEMFSRDRARMADCRQRLNEMPLGAAALAGTSFPIDRDMTSKALGFAAPMKNSMDAVSSRDFALEFLAAATILGTHLSRLAEEIIMWVNPNFGFVSLTEAFTTGSSIMPQKRNPDAAELVRGKVGRLLGNFTALTVVMKGLPLTYAKDMQEDKELVFDSVDTLHLSLAAMTGIVDDMTPNKAVMEKALNLGFITATDVADWLVRAASIPFREAHHITGKLVRLAEHQQCRLDELDLASIQAIDARISKDVYSVLNPKSAVESRKSFGGTAPGTVKKAVQSAKKKLAR